MDIRSLCIGITIGMWICATIFRVLIWLVERNR